MKKIVVLESYMQYTLVIAYAIMLGLCQFILGMALMACIIVSSCNLHFDVHHWYCFLGGQVLLGEGIMAFNYADGWSSSLPMRYRRLIHPILQAIGIVYYLYGTLAAFTSGRNIASPHALVGIVSLLFVLISGAIGPMTLFKKTPDDNNKMAKAHIGMGIITFAAVSGASIAGFQTSLFDRYVRLAFIGQGKTSIIFMVLVGFYTLVILVRPIRRMMFTYTYKEPK